MAIYSLKNEIIDISVNSQGGELVKTVKGGKDFLWNANPEFWGRTSPVLFPIVGTLAKGQYLVDDEAFSLPQHGFARDNEFSVYSKTNDELWLQLTYTEAIKEVYPFDFDLFLGYKLDGKRLTVNWRVVNKDNKEIPFSIGAHPAFLATPLSDYHLEFYGANELKTLNFDAKTGLIDLDKPLAKVIDSNVLPLNKELFEKFPTLIFENISQIVLKSKNSSHQIAVNFPDFPYVGVWSPINSDDKIAPFICIEPWYGIADTSEKSGQLKDKVGIQILPIGETFEASYTITFD